MSDTPNLVLPLIAGEQALKHVTHNEALAVLDGLVQLCVEALDQTAPPATPDAGAVYGVGSGATGDWSGADGQLALYTEGGWRFTTPLEGWRLFNRADAAFYLYQSAAWAPLSLQNLSLLGVNATADATNRLAVRSNATLFNALETGDGGSGDLRLTLNKQALANTVSLVFQSAWSGRAEMGLAGGDDFAFKVSADGSSFVTSVTLAASGGFVTLNQLFGAEVSFPTIAAGVLAVTTSYAVPAPESGTSDDIDTISGGQDGSLLILTGTAGNTLTLKDGTGNLKLGADRVLSNFEDSLLLVKRGSDWIELSYADNG